MDQFLCVLAQGSLDVMAPVGFVVCTPGHFVGKDVGCTRVHLGGGRLLAQPSPGHVYCQSPSVPCYFAAPVPLLSWRLLMFVL